MCHLQKSLELAQFFLPDQHIMRYKANPTLQKDTAIGGGVNPSWSTATAPIWLKLDNS